MSSQPLTDNDLLALLLADERDGPDIARGVAGGQVDYPASFAQQRLWLWQQINPHSPAYNLPKALRIKGDLDIAALEAALCKVVDKHEVLRSAFEEVDGVPRQRVCPRSGPILQHQDLTDCPERDVYLQRCLLQEAQRPFDLGQTPLLRGVLFRLAADEQVLLLNMHHIASDAWSNPILLQDMCTAYLQAKHGDTGPLASSSIQYGDYARWQREVYPTTPDYARAASYWHHYLSGVIAPLALPGVAAATRQGDAPAALYHVQLPPNLVKGIHAQCARLGVTPFVFILGAWQLLLARYSGQSDFVVGVPNAARNREQVQDLVGYFVNTQLYRARIDGTRPCSEFLHDLRRHSLAALEHSDYPLELLAQDNDASGAGLAFQTLFNWRAGENDPPLLHLGALSLEFVPIRQQAAKFDLSIDVEYSSDDITAVLEYAATQHSPQAVARLAGHWLNLLQGLVDDPEQRIAHLPLLCAQEQQQILSDWNRDTASFSSELCIHQRIEAQVAAAPDAIAVVSGDEHLTYRHLNQRANQLAHRLRELGVGPDVLVGLALERGLEMVIGVLGILKAGGAYVPLDPQSPPERLAYIVADSGIRLLVSQSHLPLAEGVQRLDIDRQAAGLAGHDVTNPQHETRPDHLAYVIYTSGSTGKPKGTLLPHHNVMRLFQATRGDLHFNASDVWTVFHSYAFDFSVWELFGALLHGGRAVIVPLDVARSPEAFHALLVREQVTVLNQTPSAFNPLIPIACQAASTHPALALRYIVLGGEALDIRDLEPWFECFGDQRTQLVNMYGITETTVHVTCRPLSREDLRNQAVSPIGKVIPDLSWYLLDDHLHPIALGCEGELHIGRAGLARGYHQRPALTAERFIPDPFDTSEQGGGRLYRTGDLARYAAEGVIEYVGRIDHQVKIRGFRIELGEIEARLQEHPAIGKAVVLDVEGAAGKVLAAYLLASGGEALDAQHQDDLRDSVRSHLKSCLPDYMVPAHLLFVDELPLTTNGKLDRNALPKPDAAHVQRAYKAPGSELEKQVASIWAQVLKLEKVGLDDNFFELGGHSLLATQVVSRLRSETGTQVSLAEFFQGSTIGDLVRLIELRNKEMDPVQAILSKSLEELKRLTSQELDDLIS